MDIGWRRGLKPGIGIGILLLAFTLTIPIDAAGQFCDNEDPDIELSLVDLGLGSLDMYYLSDFRPDMHGMAPPLFQFTIGNQGGADRNLILTLDLDAQDGPIFSAATDPFEVEAGQTVSGTNQELASSGTIFELGTLNIADAGEDLESLILRLGFLPDGSYALKLLLTDATAGGEISICTIEFGVSNPRSIDLILPGLPFDEALAIESSPFPLFQWRSDAARFDFRLCPILPGDGSGEEAMENEPVYELQDFTTAFSGTHTWLYPPGAEPLAAGNRYCWQVEAIVPSSGGDITFSSEIFCFEMASMASALDYDEILGALLELLPPGSLDELMPLLAGFGSTGVVTMNGEAVSSAEMMILLRTLLAAGWEVDNLEIEE